MANDLVFRSTFMTERLARVLAEHALGLPDGSPARVSLLIVLERWRVGEPVTFKGAA